MTYFSAIPDITSTVPSELVSSVMASMPAVPYSKILALWFGRSLGGSTQSLSKVSIPIVMKAYFQRDPAFDDECRTYESYIDNLITHYEKHPIQIKSALEAPILSSAADGTYPTTKDETFAQILLLDQFTRNIWRSKAARRVYTASDPIARSLALYMISKNWHQGMSWLECLFLILPLGHSEDITSHIVGQQVSFSVYGSIAARVERGEADASELKNAVMCTESQYDHLKAINLFGRYPHRNEVLERESTAEEIEYMKAGGSSYGTKE